MDILRKMFKSNENGKKDTEGAAKDQFRKPQWFEESESDDELFDDDRKFAFQIFTNPMELQRHFESQMQKFMESLNELEDQDVNIEKNFKEEFLKPGFEKEILKEYAKQSKSLVDTDLDGEIYPDQLHSLLQRLPKGQKDANILPRNDQFNFKSQVKKKLSDEEKILSTIHGTLKDEDNSKRLPMTRHGGIIPMTPRNGVTPFGGVFEGSFQGPKMFSQSVMTKTIRKPDGSSETTKITQDAEGNKTTSVTRTVNGKSETVTTHNGLVGSTKPNDNENLKEQGVEVFSDRNIFVTKQGYAIPRNLW